MPADSRGARVRLGVDDDREAVVASLVLAYASDPVLRFILPAATRFRDHAGEMMRLGVSMGLAHESLYVADDRAGAALWTPPGVRAGEAVVGELMQRIVEPGRLGAVLDGFAAAGTHEPKGPTWCLQMIGVDPIRQGEGIGSALLGRGLERVDEAGQQVYLRCSNRRNVALYARHAFEVVAEAVMAPGVEVIHMVRAPH